MSHATAKNTGFPLKQSLRTAIAAVTFTLAGAAVAGPDDSSYKDAATSEPATGSYTTGSETTTGGMPADATTGVQFEDLDKDGNGYLSSTELQGASGAAADASSATIDTDQDGQVSRDEFIAHQERSEMTNSASSMASSDQVGGAASSDPTGGSDMSFDSLDQNGNGYLSEDEFQSAQGVTGTEGTTAVDTDQDGQISRTEFAAFESSMQSDPGKPTMPQPAPGQTDPTYQGTDKAETYDPSSADPSSTESPDSQP